MVLAPVMASVADVLDSVRQLLSWLERKPFDRSDQYHGVRTTLIRWLFVLSGNLLEKLIIAVQFEFGAGDKRPARHVCRDSS